MNHLRAHIACPFCGARRLRRCGELLWAQPDEQPLIGCQECERVFLGQPACGSARPRRELATGRAQCVHCGSPDAEWLVDDEVGRVLVCFACEKVMTARRVTELLHGGR